MVKTKEEVKLSRAPYYAAMYPWLKEIALNHGYCLAIHGSMNRDFDLIAIPWVESASDELDLINAMCKEIGALIMQFKGADYEQKLFGRKCYTLHIQYDYFIDLSIFPK